MCPRNKKWLQWPTSAHTLHNLTHSQQLGLGWLDRLISCMCTYMHRCMYTCMHRCVCVYMFSINKTCMSQWILHHTNMCVCVYNKHVLGESFRVVREQLNPSPKDSPFLSVLSIVNFEDRVRNIQNSNLTWKSIWLIYLIIEKIKNLIKYLIFPQLTQTYDERIWARPDQASLSILIELPGHGEVPCSWILVVNGALRFELMTLR